LTNTLIAPNGNGVTKVIRFSKESLGVIIVLLLLVVTVLASVSINTYTRVPERVNQCEKDIIRLQDAQVTIIKTLERIEAKQDKYFLEPTK
jgi:hypothetical protein